MKVKHPTPTMKGMTATTAVATSGEKLPTEGPVLGRRADPDPTSLAGYAVGITADRRWEEQAELLGRRGATVLHGPTIKTLPLGSAEDLRRATEQVILEPPDIVVANTGIGMRAWLSAAESWGLGEALHGALDSSSIFARGPKASAAAHQAGLEVTARAASELMSELIELIVATGVAGKRVAFQCHGDDSPVAISALKAAGASVIEIPIYRWILPESSTAAETLIHAIASHNVHAVTFTSAPAVRNLLLIATEMGLENQVRTALSSAVIAVMVGPVCAAAAKEVGITACVMPDKYRLGPMIRALSDALLSDKRPLTLGSVPLIQQGTTVTIDGTVTNLSAREASLLAVLLARRPQVISKRELLTLVWSGEGEEHVVEVTIARLRAKLGRAATGIVSIPRRGYRACP
jgi:uroporphyrinogen-III synthase